MRIFFGSGSDCFCSGSYRSLDSSRPELATSDCPAHCVPRARNRNFYIWLRPGVVQFQANGAHMSASSVSADPIEGRPHSGLRARYGILVLGLLVLIAAEIFLSTRQESQTWDEADHLYAGYAYWKHGDFGRNPEHPPLVKLIAASALLPLHLKEPALIPGRYFKGQDFFAAPEFLYSADADSLLARGRAMLIVFSLALALAIFAAGGRCSAWRRACLQWSCSPSSRCCWRMAVSLLRT